ncbi:hypothetical protein [Nonomuraea turkmeniaca]|nr:hypothetical protein [Nonomuraea turkmeniaca]
MAAAPLRGLFHLTAHIDIDVTTVRAQDPAKALTCARRGLHH